MDSKSKVYFFFDNTRVTLKNRTLLKDFIGSIFRKEGRKLGQLNYIFCTDERLLQINREYLAHDYYTDIITFDLSDQPGLTTAEIYISVDRVRDNAVTNSSTLEKELLRVIFHGVLHLCGYRDKSAEEQSQMREKEDHYITAYLKKVSREKN